MEKRKIIQENLSNLDKDELNIQDEIISIRKQQGELLMDREFNKIEKLQEKVNTLNDKINHLKNCRKKLRNKQDLAFQKEFLHREQNVKFEYNTQTNIMEAKVKNKSYLPLLPTIKKQNEIVNFENKSEN